MIFYTTKWAKCSPENPQGASGRRSIQVYFQVFKQILWYLLQVCSFVFFFFSLSLISLLLLFLVGTKNSIIINVKYYVKEHCLEFRVSSVNLPRNSTLRRYLSRSDPFVGFMASQSPFFPRQTSWCISLKIKKKSLK